MPVFNKLDTQAAIDLWHELALNQADELTIAHHPSLYFFFTDYLKLPAFYFLIYQEDTLAGLLPLVKTGKKYLSLPHFSYGGILWKKDFRLATTEVQLILELLNQLQKERISPGFYRWEMLPEEAGKDSSISVEIRGTKGFFQDSYPTKVVHLISLPEDVDSLTITFNTNLRRKINKSHKNGLTVRSGKQELIKDFSSVYNRNMHKIGSPTLGARFFDALVSAKGIDTMVFVVYKDQVPVGASLVMWYDGYYENLWFSTLKEFNRLYTSYLLHWEMISHAISTGAKTYSMGRSTIGSGVDRYKSQWPTIRKELYFSQNYPSPITLKDQKWMTGIWKRLPAVLVDSIGPVVAKKIY